jgi:hypothetical protein
VPTFPDLLNSAQHSALHLEMRDAYTPEDPLFLAWKRGERVDPLNAFSDWVDLIRPAVARGVAVRRARIVSEPVTDYIQYEYAVTSMNLAAGEEVRWLPRRRASAIALPGNDFWLIDNSVVQWNHFAGDGSSAGPEVTEDPTAAKLCRAAFEAVWEQAVPHEQYKV